MKKAILIDAENREIKEVEINDWRDISPAIGADLFTVVHFEQVEDVLADVYVDDEGLLRNPQFFFMVDGYPEPLAGNGLVMGGDREGESVDSPLTVEQMKDRVKFLDIHEIRRMYG